MLYDKILELRRFQVYSMTKSWEATQGLGLGCVPLFPDAGQGEQTWRWGGVLVLRVAKSWGGHVLVNTCTKMVPVVFGTRWGTGLEQIARSKTEISHNPFRATKQKSANNNGRPRRAKAH